MANKNKIQIADDVMAIIAGIATTQVDGVVSMGEGITFKAMPFIGSKSLKKGIVIEKDQNGDNLDIKITIVLKQGADIRNTCKNIQEKVKESIESMLDIKVKKVAVRVAKIDE